MIVINKSSNNYEQLLTNNNIHPPNFSTPDRKQRYSFKSMEAEANGNLFRHCASFRFLNIHSISTFTQFLAGTLKGPLQ